MNKTTDIYFVRHGETEWNLEERLQGNKNSSLTKKGREQAEKAGDKLRNLQIEKVYSSPLERAVETAKIIIRNRNIPLIKRDSLKEINLGPWEGKTKRETELSHPHQFYNFWNNPENYYLEGGETFYELQKRVSDEILEILVNNIGRTILIVSHWIAIKTAVIYFKDLPLNEIRNGINLSNGGIIRLSKNNKLYSVSQF